MLGKLQVVREYHIDRYHVNRYWIKGIQHIINNFWKTAKNKGLLSRLMSRLKILQRKTKGYSKNINAWGYAFAVVFRFTNIPTDFAIFRLEHLPIFL